jgi:hypothetical protein
MEMSEAETVTLESAANELKGGDASASSRRKVDPDQEQIVVSGRWLRMASIRDEDVRDTRVALDPEAYLNKLRAENIKADIFTFSEPLPNSGPAFNYPFSWNNLAVIPITTFDDWWQNRLTQVTRKNVRRAGRRGAEVKVVPLDEQLARGIKSIYDETPVRQGRRFWHYNKSLEWVLQANSTYRDRSEFLCAYSGEELIGFMRLIYVGEYATIMQILSKNAHFDKRPTNLLISKAVEQCVAHGIRYLVYGRFVYGKNNKSPLTEFKRRNGFESVQVRTYHVPLTRLGRLAVKTKLHLGPKHFLPENFLYWLLNLRSWFYNRGTRTESAAAAD